MTQAQFITTRPAATRSAYRSDIVLVDGWAFLSGVQPIDLDNDKAQLAELVEEQTRRVFGNLERLLGQVGMTKDDVVSVRVNIADFKRFHERVHLVYDKFFTPGRLPALSYVGVTHLTRGALVEMDFVARKSS